MPIEMARFRTPVRYSRAVRASISPECAQRRGPMRKIVTSLLAGFSMMLGDGICTHAARAEELTILWAEWDPANYLQELVNEYEKETGTKVTVETTAWPGYQTKAFAELNAKSDAYDMIVGDSQWLGAGSTGGHYVDLTDFFKKHDVAKRMAPAALKYYAE